MDLNAPCFDSVLAIDAQLAKLQAEVSQMDSEFANYKPKGAAQRDSPPSFEIEEERQESASASVYRNAKQSKAVTFKEEGGPSAAQRY